MVSYNLAATFVCISLLLELLVKLPCASSLDSLYKTFHMKLSLICTKMNLQGNTFPYEWSCTKTRFDVEVKCYLKMADLIFFTKKC